MSTMRETFGTRTRAYAIATIALIALVAALCTAPAYAVHAAGGTELTPTQAGIAKGATFKVDGNTYRVIDYDPYDNDREKGEVVLVKYGSAKTTAKIDTVTYKGEVFEVDTVGKNAFNNARGHKVKSVNIGRHVDKIKARAFFGCAKLKTLNMAKSDVVDIDRGPRGYYIDDVEIGASAFKNAGTSKLVVKCGKGNAEYRSLFKQALMMKGLRADATVIA